jgi:hypothetical protein
MASADPTTRETVKFVVGEECAQAGAVTNPCRGCHDFTVDGVDYGGTSTRCVNTLAPNDKPGCAVDKYGYGALHDIDRFVLDKERMWRSVTNFEREFKSTPG